ncbi:MAG: hypothetical protein ACKOCE_05205 [Acidimicrobiia bacterium]
MKKHRPISFSITGTGLALVVATALLVGCQSSDSTKDQPMNSNVETEQIVPSGDPAVDAVEAELTSLDADLQVIDDALAELDSLDTTAP